MRGVRLKNLAYPSANPQLHLLCAAIHPNEEKFEYHYKHQEERMSSQYVYFFGDGKAEGNTEMKNLLEKVSHDVFVWAMWTFPVCIVLVGFFWGYSKLLFLEQGGFKISLWNEKTERIVGITLWLYQNPWVFLFIAFLLTGLSVLHLKKWMPKKYSLVLLAIIYTLSLWFLAQEGYLSGKIIGSHFPADTAFDKPVAINFGKDFLRFLARAMRRSHMSDTHPFEP